MSTERRNLYDQLRKRQEFCCPDEEWRPVARNPEYSVSSCGRFRKGDKPRAVSVPPRGYRVVNISGKTYALHKLVLEAFHGPRIAGMWGCHNDGNQANNHASNLRWDTPRGNFRDRDRHGTTSRGEHRWNAKLTEADVQRAWKMHDAGMSQATIADHLGVHASIITRIFSGVLWKHVPRPQ